MRNRTAHIIILFLVLFGVLLYAVADRMLISKKDFYYARYTDADLLELIDSMIAEKVFENIGGKVTINEERMKAQSPGKVMEARVRRSLPYFFIKKGEIFFDRLSVSIVNRRMLNEDRVVRGRFMDRNGVVLVESIVNDRVWSQQRQYNYGPEFYPVTGHWSQIFGKRHLEKELDSYLRGENHLPVYMESEKWKGKYEVGDDIVVTMDSRLQKLAYDMMSGKKGAVVLLNVETGEILASVSTPSFDPNRSEWTYWREAFDDNKLKRYANRGFSTLYPPGSTFKAVVAASWLEADIEDMDSDYETNCSGKRNKYNISDVHKHGRVGLHRAFAESCNIYFSEIGVGLGSEMTRSAERFGFNADIDLLPQMKNHEYRTEMSLAFQWHDYAAGEQELKEYEERDYRRNPKIVAQGSIGQNRITATPLQMAMTASAIANRGVMMNPYMVKEINKGSGSNIFRAKPVEIERVIDRSTSKKITQMMVEVMKTGTGKSVRSIYKTKDGYATTLKDRKCLKKRTGFLKLDTECTVVDVAGKTGTAEVGDRNGNDRQEPDERPHSWFIGFAPAKDPKVAIAVIAENQGFGSATAAPIAVEVMAEAINGMTE